MPNKIDEEEKNIFKNKARLLAEKILAILKNKKKKEIIK